MKQEHNNINTQTNNAQQNIKKLKKYLYIDRFHIIEGMVDLSTFQKFVISTIIEHNHTKHQGKGLRWYVNIHRSVWTNKIGNAYVKEIKELCDKEYIQRSKGYEKGRAKAYRIAESFWNKPINITQKKRRKKLSVKDESIIDNNIFPQEDMQYLHDTLLRLRVSTDILSIINSKITEIKRTKALRIAQQIMAGNVNLKKGPKSNRIYHKWLDCPSICRGAFRLDGTEPLISIDIRTAHPFLCLYMYNTRIKELSQQAWLVEKMANSNITLGGRVKALQYSGQTGLLETNAIKLQDIGVLLSGGPDFSLAEIQDELKSYEKLLKGDIYQEFARLTNTTRDFIKVETNKFYSGGAKNAVYSFMESNFPWLFNYIVNRNKRIRSMALELQDLEASIMIGEVLPQCRKEGLVYLSEHDGCSTIEKDRERVKQIIEEAVIEKIHYEPKLKVTPLSW